MIIQYKFCCRDMQIWFARLFVFTGEILDFKFDFDGKDGAPPINHCPFCGQSIILDELDSEEVEDSNASKD